MAKKAKTIGIIGIKGGVGKTSLTANLGTSLAKDHNKKVLIVDANFSTPHLGYHLGLINPDNTLQKAINEEIQISKALYKHHSGAHIIPGALHNQKINHKKLKNILRPLKSHYDLILLDSSPTLHDEIHATLNAADELLVVSSPDYPTMSSTFHAIKLAQQNNVPIRGIVINKTRNKEYEISKKDIEEVTELGVLSMIPDDEKVLEALSQTIPIVLHSPKSPAAIEFKKLAESIIKRTRKSKKK
jgi:septum site-determining protein MinD